MIATIPYIKSKFEEFNALMFGGKLPPVAVALTKARTFLGACRYKKRRTFFGRTVYYDFELRISTYFDLPENELEDIIIHEMIHYYICVKRLKDTSAHGRLFRQIMSDINERHGRHITLSHRTTAVPRDEAVRYRIRQHAVAVVTFHNGRVGFKVLPYKPTGIIKYRTAASLLSEVRSVDLYISDNAFFNRFPHSAALRVHYIEAADIEKHLSGAKVLYRDEK